MHQPALLLMAIGFTVLAAAFHELGHSAACRYGSAELGVNDMGIYLFWPASYNDMTDVYRLNRCGRLRADPGGVYFNILFILVLVGAYAITGYQPLLGGSGGPPRAYPPAAPPLGPPRQVLRQRPSRSSRLAPVRATCAMQSGAWKGPAPALARPAASRIVATACGGRDHLVAVSLCRAASYPPTLLPRRGRGGRHAPCSGPAGVVHSGSPVQAALNGLQLVFPAVPLAGLGITAAGATRWAGGIVALEVATAVRRDGGSRG